MLAHRVTTSVGKRGITLALPAAFLNRQVEIIVIPVAAPAVIPKRTPVRKRFQAVAEHGARLTGFAMPAREERNAR